MNTVHLVGKIATNIRMREFPSSTRPEPMVKASFLLAVPPPVKSGEPDWVPVETWNTQARNLARFNRKGSRIAVSGRLRSRFYDKDGKERGGTLHPTVVADGIDYLTQPRTEAAAVPAPAPTGRFGKR